MPTTVRWMACAPTAAPFERRHCQRPERATGTASAATSLEGEALRTQRLGSQHAARHVEDNLKSASVAAYSAAADTFDDPVLSFWDRFGRATPCSTRAAVRARRLCRPLRPSVRPAACW